MGNREEKCPFYVKGEARELYFLGSINVVCSLKACDCPYNKGEAVSWEGDFVTICRSRGLLTKSELEKGLSKKP